MHILDACSGLMPVSAELLHVTGEIDDNGEDGENAEKNPKC